jgi:hypothetical protein
MERAVRSFAAVALVGAVVGGGAGMGAAGRKASAATCRPRPLSSSYVQGVEKALLARQDVWGNALLRGPGGPTYERARRYLEPLLFAGAPRMRRLTDSGVYYLAFGQPRGPAGAGRSRCTSPTEARSSRTAPTGRDSCSTSDATRASGTAPA